MINGKGVVRPPISFVQLVELLAKFGRGEISLVVVWAVLDGPDNTIMASDVVDGI
jgi:hypothetical protein